MHYHFGPVRRNGVFDCILFALSHAGSCPLGRSSSTYSHNTSDKHSNLSKCWRAGCKVTDPVEDRTLIMATNVGATNKPHRMKCWTSVPKLSLHEKDAPAEFLAICVEVGTPFSANSVFSLLDGKSMRLHCFYSRLYQCSALNRQQFYTFFN